MLMMLRSPEEKQKHFQYKLSATSISYQAADLVHVQHHPPGAYCNSALHSTSPLFATLFPGAYINWIR